MPLLIKPRPLAGELNAIPAKAQAHRALIAAALANKPTLISPIAPGEDIAATVACLRQLGAVIEENAASYAVSPIKQTPPTPLLDCGESGATLRLLLPLAAHLAPGARFCGQGRLPQRPLKELLETLQTHGAAFSGDKLPFSVEGKLSGGLFSLPGHISSQYISGLLLALPLLAEDSEINLTSPLQSTGYVRLTIETLRNFSVSIASGAASFFVKGRQPYKTPGSLSLEGDWSGAACFLAAGALGGPITLHGLSPASQQPDARIAALLRDFGATVIQQGDSITVERNELRGQDIDVADTPDLAPVLAVLGSLACGTTRLYNAARLRYKESDRLLNTAALLKSLGALVREEREALVISGQPSLRGGQVHCARDHRLVMAAALTATACRNEVLIEGAGAVEKSYPAFFSHYNSLGGEAYDVLLG